MSRLFPPEESGTAFVHLHGQDIIRHHGDPEAEYRAAMEGVAVRDRSHRRQWAFTGRQPLEMLSGIVTGAMPPAPDHDEMGLARSQATYHTVLTPKGKMVSELWLWREPLPGGREIDEAGSGDRRAGIPGDGANGTPASLVRAHIPLGAAPGLQEHLSRFLPPRLAKLEDRSGEVGMICLAGPDAARVLSGVVLGLRVETSELAGLEEGEILAVTDSDADRLAVIRNGQLPVPAFDVVGPRPAMRAVWRLVTDAGAEPLGLDVWNTLRVEAGRPAWDNELAGDRIPVEAGIQDRAIDYHKGCYTGQEVIIRIRDRGRVNRHLRRLTLEITESLPETGTELFRDGERSVGHVTTAVDSPRRGKLALAYLRREVEPGQTVNVGSPDGPRARVEALPE